LSVSADIEMVRPALGDDGVYGVEGAGVPDKWSWRFGTALQYERAPVLVISESMVVGEPVSHRVGGWAGLSLGLGRGFAVQAVVPAAWQTGDSADWSANGAGLSDPRLGVRWAALDGKVVRATLRADGYIPAGRQEAWLGESTPRGAFGVSGVLDGGFGSLVVDAGLMARPLEEPASRLDWGTTGEFSVGLRANVTDAFDVGGAWVGRAVLAGLDTADGELASEGLLGVGLQLKPDLRVGAGGGMGVQPGIGSATFRGFANLNYAFDTKKRERPPPAVVESPPPPKKEELLEEIPGVTDVPPPPPPPPVKVVGDEIVFREEIRFELGSDKLLPESMPVIRQIAEFLASDGRIAHVAIEGYASQEGGLEYNWDLSDRRARAVWEALILEGVSPARMSWRGLGEVVPNVEGGGETTISANRAVVLRIARRLAKDEALEAPPAEAMLPWNGQATPLDTVVIPETKAPPPTDLVDPNAFKDTEEEE
jgi:outer membrane protein OmpA-like peptidoglycan-associated protein